MKWAAKPSARASFAASSSVSRVFEGGPESELRARHDHDGDATPRFRRESGEGVGQDASRIRGRLENPALQHTPGFVEALESTGHLGPRRHQPVFLGRRPRLDQQATRSLDRGVTPSGRPARDASHQEEAEQPRRYERHLSSPFHRIRSS